MPAWGKPKGRYMGAVLSYSAALILHVIASLPPDGGGAVSAANGRFGLELRAVTPN